MGKHIIDMNDLQAGAQEWKDFRTAMGDVINPLLTKPGLKYKNHIELCQIGKFLVNLDRNIRITDMPAPPDADFLFSFQGKIIALEHSRMTNPAHEQRVFSIQDLLNKAALRFQEKYPECKLMAEVWFPNDQLTYSKNDQHNHIEEICDYIFSVWTTADSSKSAFVEKVRLQKNKKVSFSFHEHNFVADRLPKSVVEKYVAMKENKLAKYYSQNSNIDEFWLVLVCGSLSRSSYEFDEYTTYSLPSKFDKVFLMADFDETVMEVKI